MPGALRQTYTFTIANGAALSSTVDLGGAAEFGGSTASAYFITPAAWDAAAVTMQVSHDGSTWYNLYSGATEASLLASVVTGIQTSVGGSFFAGARYCRFRSGTAAAPVNQTADRVFTLVVSRPA